MVKRSTSKMYCNSTIGVRKACTHQLHCLLESDPRHANKIDISDNLSHIQVTIINLTSSVRRKQCSHERGHVPGRSGPTLSSTL